MEEFKNNFLNVVQNNYVNFNGRARRKEYWQYIAVYIVLTIIVSIIAQILGVIGTVGAMIGGLLSAVLGLGLLLPSLGVAVRRLHDTNKSGWFLLLGLIPLVQFYLIYLLVIEGDKGANQYGEDPKA